MSAALGPARNLHGLLMLYLDRELPERALLGVSVTDPSTIAAEYGAVWYSAAKAKQSSGKVVGIDPLGEGASAECVEGNDGNATLGGSSARRYIQLRRRTPCGFAAQLPRSTSVISLAVFFRVPEKDGGTLAAIAPIGARDYLHLSHEDDRLVFERRNSKLAAKVDCPFGPEIALAIASMNEKKLSVALGADDPTSVQRDAEAQDAQFELFIGCRRWRAGLKNTLGSAQLFDVVAFPGVDIFDDASGPARDALLQHQSVLAAHEL